MTSAASPLLGGYSRSPPPTPGPPSLKHRQSTVVAPAAALKALGIQNRSEARTVGWLALQAHLANAVFALGRNVGPVLFMREVGAEGLTGAMFASGIVTLASTPLYGRLSRGKMAAHVNFYLVLFIVLVLFVVAGPLLLEGAAAGGPLVWWSAYVLFIAEDLLTMLLMMQSSSLAQVQFTSYDAKRRTKWHPP